MTKRFINIVIDSLNPQVFAHCIKLNKTPALKFLVENGRMTLNCISAFPTMTPVAAASIATGTLVDQHLLPGFIWYNFKEQRKINYGATKRVVMKLGVYRVVEDFLFQMNLKHLNTKVPTIFEILEEKGIRTGVINFFCFRGTTEYQVRIPLSMLITSGFRLKGSVEGPSHLVLGKLVNRNDSLISYFKRQKRFGFNDYYTFQAAVKMLKLKPGPKFILIYFPDNDSYSHQHGPLNTEPSIIKADKYIGEILSQFGSWHRAIRENVFLIIGDHSQSQVLANGLALIKLEHLFSEINKEIIICPNERMAYIHCLHEKSTGKQMADLLVRDSRIGIIAWRMGKVIHLYSGGTNKKLEFSKGNQVIDEVGACWNYRGDLAVVDGRLERELLGQRLVCQDYPAAFQRLASVLNYLPENTVVVSARPGYEFDAENAPVHVGGGSHGSLHQSDSLVPLVIAGSDLWPEYPMITNLKNLWCNHFGLNPPSQGSLTKGHLP